VFLLTGFLSKILKNHVNPVKTGLFWAENGENLPRNRRGRQKIAKIYHATGVAA
jgi:hypothetical protein